MKIPSSIYKFVVSGGIATGIDFVIYIVLKQFLLPSIAKTISMLCANVWSYIVNKRWVFSNERKTDSKMIVTYVVAQAINLGVNVGTNSLMLHLTNQTILSFIVATLCATIVNYALQKIIVFK